MVPNDVQVVISGENVFGKAKTVLPGWEMERSYITFSVMFTYMAKRDFADVVKVRILRWGGYAGFSRCNHQCPFKWGS